MNKNFLLIMMALVLTAPCFAMEKEQEVQLSITADAISVVMSNAPTLSQLLKALCYFKLLNRLTYETSHQSDFLINIFAKIPLPSHFSKDQADAVRQFLTALFSKKAPFEPQRACCLKPFARAIKLHGAINPADGLLFAMDPVLLKLVGHFQDGWTFKLDRAARLQYYFNLASFVFVLSDLEAKNDLKALFENNRASVNLLENEPQNKELAQTASLYRLLHGLIEFVTNERLWWDFGIQYADIISMLCQSTILSPDKDFILAAAKGDIHTFQQLVAHCQTLASKDLALFFAGICNLIVEPGFRSDVESMNGGNKIMQNLLENDSWDKVPAELRENRFYFLAAFTRLHSNTSLNSTFYERLLESLHLSLYAGYSTFEDSALQRGAEITLFQIRNLIETRLKATHYKNRF